MAAAAPAEQLQRALLAPLSLARVLAAPELQPLRTAAAAAGHVALAMCGGRALYVFDGPLPTAPAGREPAGARRRRQAAGARAGGCVFRPATDLALQRMLWSVAHRRRCSPATASRRCARLRTWSARARSSS